MSNRSKWYRHETETQKQAFELYYGMGLKRSYAKVASQTRVSTSTIKNWARAFGWRTRVEQREEERLAAMKRNQSDTVDHLVHLMQLVEAATAVTLKGIGDPRVKPTVSELARLIEGRLDLEDSLPPDQAKTSGGMYSNVIIYKPDDK